MRDHARVVVIGGGCVGAAVLYGLARRGWRDCLLLERSRLAGGSTRLAGGFIPTYVRSDAGSRMIRKTIAIYEGLEADTGQAVGWHRCGQMRIARDSVRLDEYLSYMNIVEAVGARATLLSPDEAVALWPLIEEKRGILGALYHPDDGYVAPTDVTMAMARGARDRGARIVENTAVVRIDRQPGGEWQLTTTGREVLCEHVVLATGTYARDTGAMLGLNIPCMPVLVQYWLTDVVPEIVERRRRSLPEMPIMRDEYFLGYMREEGDGLMFGTYERPEHLQLFGLDGVPDHFDGGPMPADFDANAWGFERAAAIMPAFGRAGIKGNVRGPMQMTADGMPLVGPAPGLHNVWLAEGVPGGILWGGGIGHFLSEWIVEGQTTIDMNELDPRRFGEHATKRWIKQKAVELWGAHSDIILPGQELPAGRPAKTSPSYDLLSGLGAVWGAVNGWEIANWYAPRGVEPVDTPGYRATPNGRYLGEEAAAVRSGVGLLDLSAAAKFEVSGRGAVAFLDRVFATALPAVGMVRPAYQLFDNGGVRAAFTLARLEEDLFYLVSSPRTEQLNFDELWRLLPQDGSVVLRNATMERGGCAITGPKAAHVLASLTEGEVSNHTFPPASVRSLSLGLANDARLMRVSSTGELGWEIYAPIAFQRYLVGQILAAGEFHELRLIGQRALNALRLEKSYRVVGPDLNVEIAALEAGLGEVLDLAKATFLGADSVRAQQVRGAARKLVTITVATDGASVLGHEGVYHEGKLVGRITSGAFSPFLGKGIALALVPRTLAAVGTELTVPVLDAVCAACVVADSPYDPENLRGVI